MYIDTSELCDIYADQVDVVEPIFSSFGGVSNFYGKVTTVKCFEKAGDQRGGNCTQKETKSICIQESFVYLLYESNGFL